MIGIIGAMDTEIVDIKKGMEIIKEEKVAYMTYIIGRLKGVDIVLAHSYEGKVNAAVCTQVMISKYNPSKIINVGAAGGLSQKLAIGGIAISDRTVEFDFDTSILGYELGFVFGLNQVYVESDKDLVQVICKNIDENENVVVGTIASSDRFLHKKEDLETLKNSFDNVIAADMESASIAHVCKMNDVKFCAIRAISDNGNGVEFKEFVNVATSKIGKIIMNVIDKI